MNQGYSCSQAILCAYCSELGISVSDAKIKARPYSGGAKIKCGAVLAAELLLENEKDKTKFESEFISKNSSVICRELRGNFQNPQLRSCIGCVEDSANILESFLKKKEG
jgi:Putative redox-active protein (C_GCAxxG_C_C).